MIVVRGRYTGTNIILLEPISLPPDTEVEILIPDIEADGREALYWERLKSQGLITEVRPLLEEDESFDPIIISGKPMSETIIEERR
jgi:hypothetical protein